MAALYGWRNEFVSRNAKRSRRNRLSCGMPSVQVAVDLSGVVRRFRRRRAVNGVDLSLRSGDCLALFGANGAGTPTPPRATAGPVKPAEGSVHVSGQPL